MTALTQVLLFVNLCHVPRDHSFQSICIRCRSRASQLSDTVNKNVRLFLFCFTLFIRPSNWNWTISFALLFYCMHCSTLQRQGTARLSHWANTELLQNICVKVSWAQRTDVRNDLWQRHLILSFCYLPRYYTTYDVCPCVRNRPCYGGVPGVYASSLVCLEFSIVLCLLKKISVCRSGQMISVTNAHLL